MAHEVKGVVATGKGEPVTVTTVIVPDPGPGEALVAVQACGVCHTDLHYREGGIGEDFPYLLGHEAAGVVEAVGPDVTGLAPGDFVILNWRAVCGQCRACLRGRPWYCFATHNATQKMTLADGTPLSPALGIGAFAEKTLVAAGQCTKVDPAIKPEVAGLLGCGVMAGLGAAINTAGVTRGDSVAVIGCGGVGNAAILGAVLAGARKVIAVDVDDRKLEWARGFGATDTVNSQSADPVEKIRDLTDGNGADVVIEAVGRPETYRQAFYARDLAGTVVLVGVPTPQMQLELPLLDVFGRGGVAEVVLVRRLPAQPRLPDAGRPAPAGAAAAGQVRVRDDRAGRGRGGIRQDAARGGAPLGRDAVTSQSADGPQAADRPQAARIAMWSGPRTVSTALMRSFENRPDTIVVDEPLYGFYLASTTTDHPGRDEIIASMPADWREVVDGLATAPLPDGISVYYQKHMTHHLLPQVDRAAFAGLRHAFLIRDPRRLLASYARVRSAPVLADLGLPQQAEIFGGVRRPGHRLSRHPA